MTILRELQNVRQISGEHRRRWFASEAMDLIVWLDEADAPVGFQLCYDKGRSERALTLTADGAFSHTAVDDGEGRRNGYKETPILVASASFDAGRVGKLFSEASEQVPAPIAEFVQEKIRSYPEGARSGPKA